MPPTLEAGNEREWSVDLGGVHVVFGDGTVDRLGERVRELGCRRVLLVTDPGLLRAGHADRAGASLRRAGLAVRVFDEVAENPGTADVRRGARAAREHGADCLVGLGGGSVLDGAKGINFLVTNGGRMEDYWGDGKARRPMLPSIGVPTTAGTGSEAQRFALISQGESHRKMACGDRKARFRTAILDPTLLASMPREVAATSGSDALSHALESYVTRRRNPVSRLYAGEAWRLLAGSFATFLEDPDDGEAPSRMLLGAHLAGAAIETSMLGAAHACANPLTARYGLVHGTAVALMLPHVVRFNASAVGDLYEELAAGGAQALSDQVVAFRDLAGLPGRLRDCGVGEGDLPALAAAAAEEWTAQFNPRPASVDDLRGLYEAAF